MPQARTRAGWIAPRAVPGDGGSGGGGALAFDFKAYRGAVTLGSGGGSTRAMPPPPAGPQLPDGIEIDEEITWVSQWGKLVDLTFRFTVVDDNVTRTFPPATVWATITGVGITMSGYRQPMTIMYGTASANEESGAQLMPFEIAMVDDSDFMQGYVLRNMITFSITPEKPMFFKGNEQLITRTYFKDGELTYSPDDFT